MKELLLVGVGGFFGSIARYAIYLITLKHISDKTYLATLVVNLIGCLLIGLLSGTYLKLSHSQNLMLITGLCGGFTTFSTFAFDGFKLIKAGLYLQFGFYAIASTVGGILLCLIGITIANR